MHINAGMHISRGLAQRGCFRLALGLYLRFVLCFFFFFFFQNSNEETRYNRASCRENSRDATILLRENARQDVCMAENVRRIATTSGLTRELASINGLRIRFFLLIASLALHLSAAAPVSPDANVNMQDVASGYTAAEKSQPYTVVKIKFSEYCWST